MKRSVYVVGGIAAIFIAGSTVFIPRTEVKGVAIALTPTPQPTAIPTEIPTATPIPVLIKKAPQIIAQPTATPTPAPKQEEPKAEESKITTCQKGECDTSENNVTIENRVNEVTIEKK